MYVRNNNDIDNCKGDRNKIKQKKQNGTRNNEIKRLYTYPFSVDANVHE